MAEIDDIQRILRDHQHIPFVQRILDPGSYPQMDIGEGQVATHLMEWSDVDTPEGVRYLVYPRVRLVDGQLKDYGDRAFDEAMRTGDYIAFDRKARAAWFSKNYKKVWGDQRPATSGLQPRQ